MHTCDKKYIINSINIKKSETSFKKKQQISCLTIESLFKKYYFDEPVEPASLIRYISRIESSAVHILC